MKNQNLRWMAISLIAALTASACTKSESPAPAPEQATTAPSAPTAPAAKLDPNAKPEIELTIGSDGDQIAFDKKELRVKAGKVVRLTFKNNSKSSNMEHNWVLARPGTENDVANEGIQAGAGLGWIKDSDKILAHTKLTAPGATEAVMFIAPPAGSYPYMCTFPGHPMLMKGVLISE
jgi:azurin